MVWIPPGEKHWHGASPTNGMTHIAMQEALDGSYVTWMEHVTDAEYSAKSVSFLEAALASGASRSRPSVPGKSASLLGQFTRVQVWPPQNTPPKAQP